MYAESDQTTFMTLPGIVAILSFSGSLFVVATGMFFIVFFLILVEIVQSRAIGNPFVASIAGLAMATTAVELNFPLLAVWFFVELLATLLFIWAAQTVLGTVRYEILEKDI